MTHTYTIEIEVKDIYEAIEKLGGPNLPKTSNNMNAYGELNLTGINYKKGSWEEGVQYKEGRIRRFNIL